MVAAAARDTGHTPDYARMKIPYITCSPFSGSTLLSFLLNLHPEVVTAGHSTGWSGLTPDFQCSCGAAVSACGFFDHIRRSFDERGKRFPFSGYFPNAYRISGASRVNQLVFDNLPRLASTRLEMARDRLVRQFPWVSRRIREIDESNEIFFSAACSYAGATVYVDNSHSVFRFRHLARIPSLELIPIHLVRDVRGVALSDAEVYGRRPQHSALHWIRAQEHIVRVLRSSERLTGGSYSDNVVSYETLCDNPLSCLNELYHKLGLQTLEKLDDFKSVEHHILGNQMRFGGGEVRKSERWKTALRRDDQRIIATTVQSYAQRSPYYRELQDILETLETL